MFIRAQQDRDKIPEKQKKKRKNKLAMDLAWTIGFQTKFFFFFF